MVGIGENAAYVRKDAGRDDRSGRLERHNQAALAVLRERGFEEALRAAMAACTRRADELSAM